MHWVVLKTMLNICDRAFLQKYFKGEICQLFSQKNSIKDMGPKCTSGPPYLDIYLLKQTAV